MAQFYGDLQGNRGEATRMGTKSSGIRAHVRGWNVGARIHVKVDRDGNDHVYVYRTSGSNGSRSDVLIADFTSQS